VIAQIIDVTGRRLAEQERDRMETDLRLAQKLEAVGQLAAGVAHEINTPIQFVGDTIHFLDEAFSDLTVLVDAYDPLIKSAGLAGAVAGAQEQADLEYLRERVPLACARGAEGIRRVSTIVQAMRDFAHTGNDSGAPVDINEALERTLIVAANELKYVADVETDLAAVPPVVAVAGDLNQVFLNLIVNAAHAVADVVRDGGARGRIRIATACAGESVVITVSDTGCGIPEELRARVFDPFFTTKPVGAGTGQGLAIARSIIDKHAGVLTLDSEVGAGTTFTIVLPIAGPPTSDEDRPS
jgi:signal transduction histidine kinase